MKKKYIIIPIIILIILCMICFLIVCKKDIKTEKKENISEQKAEQQNDKLFNDEEQEKRIEEIKEGLGYNNQDIEIYEVRKEYDGREILTIKQSIQYKVAMAGAIKGEKPEFSEIDSLLEEAPTKSGIWITKNSREKFLNMLKEHTDSKYKIDDKGYLILELNKNLNEIDEKIKNLIDGGKLYAIDINKNTYIVDEVTGDIEEYPFEEIDPFSIFELFETENASLYIITPNTNNKLETKDILKQVIENIAI